MKSAETTRTLQGRLAIRGYEGYCLRPLCTEPNHISDADVACLTQWRNRHKNAFLTEFEATESRTHAWLCEHVHTDDTRLLFTVRDASEKCVGYMGIAYIAWNNSYGEADAIVKGLPTPKGLMSAGLRTMLKWARECLGIKRIGVRVLSDNKALSFYSSAGFKETHRTPLVATLTSDGIAWREDPQAEYPTRHLVYHILEDHEDRNH